MDLSEFVNERRKFLNSDLKPLIKCDSAFGVVSVKTLRGYASKFRRRRTTAKARELLDRFALHVEKEMEVENKKLDFFST
jgi:hypothetical protein